MMYDVLLEIDDDLLADIGRKANLRGVSVEELLREMLATNVGRPYVPLSSVDEALMRPMLRFDIRTKSAESTG
jgi:hypothetical protein